MVSRCSLFDSGCSVTLVTRWKQRSPCWCAGDFRGIGHCLWPTTVAGGGGGDGGERAYVRSTDSVPLEPCATSGISPGPLLNESSTQPAHNNAVTSLS